MSALFDKGREAFGNAEIALLADDIQVQLVDVGVYTVDLAADQYLDDIPGGALVGAAVSLTGKSNTGGVFDADDLSVTGLPGTQAVGAAVIVKNTGDPATSPVIAYIDDATGIPVASDAVQVNVTWSNGANRIFKL